MRQSTKRRCSCVFTIKYTFIRVYWWTRQIIHNTLIVVNWYLRLMGDKTIPHSAEPRLESFYPPFVAGINLPHQGVVDSYNLYNGNSYTGKTTSLYWDRTLYILWVLYICSDGWVLNRHYVLHSEWIVTYLASAYTFTCICITFTRPQWFKSLWPSDAIWRHRSGSTLAQVMACCLTAPSHYLNQCWLTISKIQLHSSDGNFTRDTSVIND